MSLYIALLLWSGHGALLWQHRRQFRLRIALLHGLAAAAPAIAIALLAGWFSPAALLPGAAGVGLVVGLAGGRGHRLAPGLWFGNGLLWLLVALGTVGVPALSGPLLTAYALAAQMGLLGMALVRS